LDGSISLKLSSPVSVFLVKSKIRFHLLTLICSLPSSSMKDPTRRAESACSWSSGYLKLYGPKVRLVDDSTMGSFGVYTLMIESVRSLHLNYEQHTVISQLSQFLKKMLALMGPMKNLVFLHLSTVT